MNFQKCIQNHKLEFQDSTFKFHEPQKLKIKKLYIGEYIEYSKIHNFHLIQIQKEFKFDFGRELRKLKI